MRIAALVFVIAGLAYLMWDVSLTVTNGVGLGTLYMALFAAALIYQGYALFRAKKGARWSAVFIALIVAGSCAFIVGLLIMPWLSDSVFAIPESLWPMVGVLIAVTLAFAIAAVMLAFLRTSRPNPAVNADAPSARRLP